jgi:hypothetical protein
MRICATDEHGKTRMKTERNVPFKESSQKSMFSHKETQKTRRKDNRRNKKKLNFEFIDV